MYGATQPRVITLTLGRDQIALVKTAPGLATRMTFPEQINEIICGDLYDPSSGKGNFVVQHSGNDLFIKPIGTRGTSNLFVKTAVSNEYIYSFDLQIVDLNQAHRIVNVLNAQRSVAAVKSREPLPPAPPLIKKLDSIGFSPVALLSASLPAPVSRDLIPAPTPLSLESAPRRVVRRVVPDYPELARQFGMEGEVGVEVIINKAGKIVSARALSGPQVLRDAAVTAARKWQFDPVVSDRAAERQSAKLTFRFHRFETKAESELYSQSSGKSNKRR
jgi:TonB family protein